METILDMDFSTVFMLIGFSTVCFAVAFKLVNERDRKVLMEDEDAEIDRKPLKEEIDRKPLKEEGKLSCGRGYGGEIISGLSVLYRKAAEFDLTVSHQNWQPRETVLSSSDKKIQMAFISEKSAYDFMVDEKKRIAYFGK